MAKRKRPAKDAVREAARVLSALGASKGGKARAKVLSSEERIEIASKAGKARLTKLKPEQRRQIAKRAASARWKE